MLPGLVNSVALIDSFVLSFYDFRALWTVGGSVILLVAYFCVGVLVTFAFACGFCGVDVNCLRLPV